MLVPFGGAGPLHAARVAEDLGIATVIVPPNAGVLSASGLLLADHVHYRTRTRRLAVSEANMADIRETVEVLQAQARDHLAGLGIETAADFDRVLEMRYLGQAFEVPVSLSNLDLEAVRAEDLAARFGEAHRRIFEFAKPHGDPVEVVSFRVGVKAPPPPMPAMRRPRANAAGEGRRTVFTERGETLDAGLLARADLGPVAVGGPLLVDDGSATVYVPPGWTAERDEEDNVILRREASA